MANVKRLPPIPQEGAAHTPHVQAGPSNAREGEPLGALLIKAGAIKREQLEAALISQRQSFKPLGRILRDDAGLTEEALAAALRKQNGYPRVFLSFFPIKADAVTLLEKDFCRQHEVIAFEKLGKLVCVAISNTGNRNLLKHVELQSGSEIKIFHAPWEDIQRGLERLNHV